MLTSSLANARDTKPDYERPKYSADEKYEMALERCAPPLEDEPVIYQETYSGQFDADEMAELAETIYKGDKRLEHRAGYYKDREQFVSVQDPEDPRKNVVFTKNVIKGVILQIEEVMRRRYARHVFFPDMGHAHLYIPMNYYKEKIQGQTTYAEESVEKAFESSGLKMLYHTAEKLILLDDNKQLLPNRELQWRYYMRNPVGDLKGNITILRDFEPDEGHNTANGDSKLPGYKYFSGFNLSANNKGCFPFETPEGELKYFDMSISHLPCKTCGMGGF